MRQYFVYILTGRRGVLYVGVTNNLPRRMQEHRTRIHSGFTAKYRVSRLVYYECCTEARVAIAREKELKGWLRSKKIALIKQANPGWKDLCGDWFS
jgi:putative endonuclease